MFRRSNKFLTRMAGSDACLGSLLLLLRR